MRKTKQTLKTNCSFTKISTFTLLSSIWLNIAHLSFCLYDLVYDTGALPGPLKWISGKQNCVIKALIIYSLLNKLKFIWMSLVDGTTTHTNTYTCWVLQTQLLRTYTGSTFLQGVMLCFFSHAHVSCHSSMVLSRQRHEADVDWCSSHTYTHTSQSTPQLTKAARSSFQTGCTRAQNVLALAGERTHKRNKPRAHLCLQVCCVH